MAAKAKPARVIQFAEIEKRFRLVPFQLYGINGLTTYPAVRKRGDGTYSIRVDAGSSVRGGTTTEKSDYFRFDAEGTITQAPRGFARDYRPGRVPVEELEKAVARYAEAVTP
jgi:hypothetical protein